MIKTLALTGSVAAAVIMSAPVAFATDLNCSDFASPVVIVNGFDPDHLDADGDGIGCESNPGQPVTSDLYSDLRDPALADTGVADLVHRHPVRTMGAAGLLVGAGVAVVVVARRRVRTEGE